MSELIVNDANAYDFLTDYVDGRQVRRGLVPRDFSANPAGCYASSTPWSMDIPTIPRSEWSDRIQQMETEKSRISDIRNVADGGNPIKSLDQNGQGFCWAYSTTMGVMLKRAVDNMPYVRLSPHAVACKIYNHQDRGAWGALSLDFIAEHGVPSEEYWPQQSMSRQWDVPQTWENAKLHRVTEGWMDLDIPAYDRELSFDQVATCLLSRFPVTLDYNWWDHSVCGMDLVELDPGKRLSDPNRWGIRIINSWADSWGTNGAAVLQGTKAIPDGACCPRLTVAS